MDTYKNDNYSPNYITPPGATLEETLESLHMSQAELAKRISRPEKTISEIINGTTAITPDTSIQLERALGVPASFWNNLEKNYQEQKARIESKNKLEEELELLPNYPYKDMAKLGWVKQTLNKEDQIENLLSFFAVNSLHSVQNVMQINFRKHSSKNVSQGAIAAWLRKGEIDAIDVQTQPFDEKKLRSYIVSCKTMSNDQIQEFSPILKAKLAECGIALVFTQDLPRTYVCGASRWLSSNKALVQLSMRGGFADIMWFTLYHELGHLLLHSKKERYVDVTESFQKSDNDVEATANKFSAEHLIPLRLLREFLSRPLSRETILNFANELGIHPGIVVGRLQHEEVIKFSDLNGLRTKYNLGKTTPSN